MKILIINEYCGIKSTGRICGELAEQFSKHGHTVKIAYGRDGYVPERYEKYSVRIGNYIDIILHGIYTRLTDKHGLGSKRATKNFLKWAENFNPDIIWLHNLHGYYVNYELLFGWIKLHPEKEIRWTLHDCWPFTGHCSHFTMVKCERWKDVCYGCPQLKRYPKCLLWGNVVDNYNRKKKQFTGINNMQIFVPSIWLGNLVKQSFLSEYPVIIMPNEADVKVFNHIGNRNIKRTLGIEGKKMILGVASDWTEYKGLNIFTKLSDKLDEKYKIVLVGLSRKQMKKISQNIIGIERTYNARELAAYYSEAEVHVSASFEETFGMTILEAALCGTPSIVFQNTACEEVLDQVHEKVGGIAVQADIESIYDAITNEKYKKKQEEV